MVTYTAAVEKSEPAVLSTAAAVGIHAESARRRIRAVVTYTATVKAANPAVLITAAAVIVQAGSVDSTVPGTPTGQPRRGGRH